MTRTSHGRLIIVAGMHRSGTSVITRALKVMNIDLGNNLVAPVENDNPTGFWEDRDINALNQEMLAVVGNDWHHLLPVVPADIAILHEKGYFDRAMNLLATKMADFPLFGLKDPRLSKLLPFWKEIFNQLDLHTDYILTLRNPLSVAKSLAKRDGFAHEKGYLLWLTHVLKSLSDTSGLKRLMVDYDFLMRSSHHEINRMARFLNLDINLTEMNNFTSEFLDENLRHTIHDSDDLSSDEACHPIVRDAYAALIDVAADKTPIDDQGLTQQIDHWLKEIDLLRPCLAISDKLCTAEQQIKSRLEQNEKTISAMSFALGQNEKTISEMSLALEQNEKTISAMRLTLSENAQKITELHLLIEKITQSISWKLTAPLRYAKKLFYYGKF